MSAENAAQPGGAPQDPGQEVQDQDTPQGYFLHPWLVAWAQVFDRRAAAVWYARAGFWVVILHGWTMTPDGVACTCRKGTECDTPGKHPRFRHWHSSASNNAAHVGHWFEKLPESNIGICPWTDLVVVDIDPRNGGDLSWREVIDRFGPMPVTVTATTGGGGLHVVFKQPEGYSITTLPVLKDYPGIDVQGASKQFVAAPSLHPSGSIYQWDIGVNVEPVPLPGRFLALLTDPWVGSV